MSAEEEKYSSRKKVDVDDDDDDDDVVVEEDQPVDNSGSVNNQDDTGPVVWLRSNTLRRPTAKKFHRLSVSDTMRWSVRIQGVDNTSRKKAIAELLVTEESYVQDLIQVRDGYMHALTADSLGNIERQAIFENWEQLTSFHKEFVKALQDVATNDPSQIGKCFLDLDLLSLYSDICINHDRQIEVLLHREENDPRFAAELAACQKALGHPLPLKDYLLKPVQRIMRYQLLLSEQIKQCGTKDTDGLSLLLQARDMVRDIVSELNERRRLSQLQDIMKGTVTLSRSRSLSDRLEGLSVKLSELGPLLAFFEDAQLQVDARTKKWRKMLCFSEGIIACKGKGSTDRLTVKAEYNLATCELKMLGGAKFSIHMSPTEWDTYSLANEESVRLLTRIYNNGEDGMDGVDNQGDGLTPINEAEEKHTANTHLSPEMADEGHGDEAVSPRMSPSPSTQQKVSSKKGWVAKLQKRDRVFSWNHKSRKANASGDSSSQSKIHKQTSSGMLKLKALDRFSIPEIVMKEGTEAEVIREVMQARVDALTSQLQVQHQELQSLIHENGRLHATISGSNTEAAIGLQEAVVDARKELKLQIAALSSKDAKLSDLSKQLQDVTEERNVLEEEADKSLDEINQLKATNASSESQLKTLTTELEHLKQSMTKSTEETKNKQKELASMQREMASMRSSTSKLDDAMQDIDRLKKELEEGERQKKEYMKKYAKDKHQAEKKIAELEQRIIDQQLQFSSELSSTETTPTEKKKFSRRKSFESFRRFTRRGRQSSSSSTGISLQGTNAAESSTDVIDEESTEENNKGGDRQPISMYESDPDTNCLLMQLVFQLPF